MGLLNQLSDLPNTSACAFGSKIARTGFTEYLVGAFVLNFTATGVSGGFVIKTLLKLRPGVLLATRKQSKLTEIVAAYDRIESARG
jgi:hypothetical protein